jgi:hypothetical protein
MFSHLHETHQIGPIRDIRTAVQDVPIPIEQQFLSPLIFRPHNVTLVHGPGKQHGFGGARLAVGALVAATGACQRHEMGKDARPRVIVVDGKSPEDRRGIGVTARVLVPGMTDGSIEDADNIHPVRTRLRAAQITHALQQGGPRQRRTETGLEDGRGVDHGVVPLPPRPLQGRGGLQENGLGTRGQVGVRTCTGKDILPNRGAQGLAKGRVRPKGRRQAGRFGKDVREGVVTKDGWLQGCAPYQSGGVVADTAQRRRGLQIQGPRRMLGRLRRRACGWIKGRLRLDADGGRRMA